MTIYFSNPGTFDIRLLSTFGVNTKPNSTNPIGHFGTGLKYAIAGVLRLGGTVALDLAATEEEYFFFTKEMDYRGKLVPMCFMQTADAEPIPLPFSTALGAHWKPWMIYREFYSNSRDEGGAEPEGSYPSAADVVFAVSCKEVEEVDHVEHFLVGKPLTTIGNVELHQEASRTIYYKGIAVYTHEKPFLYTYNFLSGLNLTEDRTVAYWDVGYTLARALGQATPGTEHHLKILLEASGGLEGSLNFDYIHSPTPTFRNVLTSIAKNKRSGRTYDYARTHFQDDMSLLTQEPDGEQAATIETACRMAGRFLPPEEDEIIYISQEADSLDGFTVQKNAIYLHPNTLSSDEHGANTFYAIMEARLNIRNVPSIKTLLHLLFMSHPLESST